MRAVLRFGLAMAAAFVSLAAAPALAQDSGQVTNNSSAIIGPRELQNFSLDGKVTRPSDQPVTLPARPASRTRVATPPVEPTAEPVSAIVSDESSRANVRKRTQTADESDRAVAPQRARAAPATAAATPLDTATARAAPAQIEAAASPGFAAEPQLDTGALAPEHRFPVVPWLLAAVALGAGAGFLFWRNRSRQALAGVPRADAFVAPEPATRPGPVPAPPKPSSSIPGLVSTRLRPWVEIGMQPLRCVLDDEKVTVEFELELFNSGSAPARAVLAEATLLNAGPDQERSVRAFFEKPVGEGERIIAIPPLKRFHVKTHVTVPRDQVQPYEVAGRTVFVPVLAFNALYRWSAGEGQTSASYLLGRDTKSEKLAPFRLDLGPRIFRGLGARLLPAAVRQ